MENPANRVSPYSSPLADSYYFLRQYYESTRYVNNQKDSLIRQLRSEIAELRQKNTEYDRLANQVVNLDSEFR